MQDAEVSKPLNGVGCHRRERCTGLELVNSAPPAVSRIGAGISRDLNTSRYPSHQHGRNRCDVGFAIQLNIAEEHVARLYSKVRRGDGPPYSNIPDAEIIVDTKLYSRRCREVRDFGIIVIGLHKRTTECVWIVCLRLL
jgi:hypothetical protein